MGAIREGLVFEADWFFRWADLSMFDGRFSHFRLPNYECGNHNEKKSKIRHELQFTPANIQHAGSVILRKSNFRDFFVAYLLLSSTSLIT